MRRLRADISPHNSAARAKSLGVDVYLREGPSSRPTPSTSAVTACVFVARSSPRGRAAAPPISGLYEAGFLTNETIFSLTELPKRLAVLGAGPIGSEMAQSFARFGFDVSLIEREGHILPREDSMLQRASSGLFVKMVFACISKLRSSESRATRTANISG